MKHSRAQLEKPRHREDGAGPRGPPAPLSPLPSWGDSLSQCHPLHPPSVPKAAGPSVPPPEPREEAAGGTRVLHGGPRHLHIPLGGCGCPRAPQNHSRGGRGREPQSPKWTRTQITEGPGTRSVEPKKRERELCRGRHGNSQAGADFHFPFLPRRPRWPRGWWPPPPAPGGSPTAPTAHAQPPPSPSRHARAGCTTLPLRGGEPGRTHVSPTRPA